MNEQVAMTIISNVGMARSMYIEAIHAAKQKEYQKAKDLIKEGQTYFNEGHHAHFDLIQQEANGEAVTPSLLLLHAEDQLMSAEAFGILAQEFVDVYQTIYETK